MNSKTCVSRAVMCLAAMVGLGACSSKDGGPNASGTGGAAGSGGAGGGEGLRTFTSPADPGPGGVLFAASGEALALTGYAFPPAPDAASFVDGWDVRFSRLLVTVDKIRLSENADAVPGDQSKTGKLVAEVDGPWAIDLHQSDPRYLPGKGGGGEQAVPIAALSTQNRNGNAPLGTDGTRYAFGFDTVPAAANAYNVNLDAEAASDYEQMVTEKCAVLYAGTATFKGDKSDADCYPADRKAWPDVVDFRLCFQSPVAYSNCQNPDNTGAALPNEEFERGVALQTNSSVIAQVTLHTDHPFWDSVVHDSPAHFDQFAARVVGQDGATPTVTLEMTKGVDYTEYEDAAGNVLNWRYCVPPPTDAHAPFTGVMRFDPETVPHGTGSEAASGLRDYYDFATYDQSTQGHLNSDGLCFVKRNYPSPD